MELRADSDEVDEGERVYIKCQREFVYKAKLAQLEAKGEMSGVGKKRVFDSGPSAGSLEDEIAKKCVYLHLHPDIYIYILIIIPSPITIF